MFLRLIRRSRPPTALTVEAVYEEHADFVWLTLQRLGVAANDLEDLFQEVFLVVHRNLHGFEGRARVTTWLLGICMKVVSGHRRRACRKREYLVESVDDRVAADEASASLEQRCIRDRIGRALGHISLKSAVFVMFEIEELPSSEIATLLGIPEGTVHSRLFAARREIQAELEQAEGPRGLVETYAGSERTMTEPLRWRVPRGRLSQSLDELRSNGRPRPMNVTERARMKERVAALRVIPVAASMFWVITRGVAIAAASAGAGLGVVHAVSVVREFESSASSPAAHARKMAPPIKRHVVVERLAQEEDLAPHEQIVGPPSPADAEVRGFSQAMTPTRAKGPRPSRLAEPADALAREVRAMDAARSKLSGAGDVLHGLDKISREFPNGQFAAEREIMAIEWLIRNDRKPEARSRAERLLLQSSGALYETRLQSLLRDTHSP